MSEEITRIRMDELPEETGSRNGFYAVGYKVSGGQKTSKRFNLGGIGEGISDAPEDGMLYLRKNGEWVKYGTPISDEIPDAGLLPNVAYELGELDADLDVTLQEPADATIRNEYMLSFSLGATAHTVTFPETLAWAGGTSPAFEANKSYEVSIVEGKGLCVSF